MDRLIDGTQFSFILDILRSFKATGITIVHQYSEGLVKKKRPFLTTACPNNLYYRSAMVIKASGQ